MVLTGLCTAWHVGVVEQEELNSGFSKFLLLSNHLIPLDISPLSQVSLPENNIYKERVGWLFQLIGWKD